MAEPADIWSRMGTCGKWKYFLDRTVNGNEVIYTYVTVKPRKNSNCTYLSLFSFITRNGEKITDLHVQAFMMMAPFNRVYIDQIEWYCVSPQGEVSGAYCYYDSWHETDVSDVEVPADYSILDTVANFPFKKLVRLLYPTHDVKLGGYEFLLDGETYDGYKHDWTISKKTHIPKGWSKNTLCEMYGTLKEGEYDPEDCTQITENFELV